MAGEVTSFGIGVTILVTGTYDTDIITDAGTTDTRDLGGPYAAHHSTMDKRGRAMMKHAARSPENVRGRARKGARRQGTVRSPPGGARRAHAVDRRTGSCQVRRCTNMTRLMMGIPRFGALAGTSAATMGASHPQRMRARSMADTRNGSFRTENDDRRQARRRRGRDLRQHQSGDRAVARRGRRRIEGRYAPRHRRRPARVRRDGLVDRLTRSANACLVQLQDALESEQEELREELILEVGCPRVITYGPQLDAPLADGAALPGQAHRRVPVGNRRSATRSSRSPGMNTTRKVWQEPVGVVGAIVPWNFPFEVTIQQARSGARHRQHGRPEAGPDTPYNATRLGRLDRRAAPTSRPAW